MIPITDKFDTVRTETWRSIEDNKLECDIACSIVLNVSSTETNVTINRIRRIIEEAVWRKSETHTQ